MLEGRSVHAPRIGSGVGYFIFGTIAFLIGGLASFGGGLSGLGAANFFTTLGVGLVAVGFWIRLFGLLELRLIDVQKTLTPRDERSE